MSLSLSLPRVRAAASLALCGGLAASGCKQGFQVSTTAYVVGPTVDIISIDKPTVEKIDPDVLNASVMIATRLESKRVKFCSGTLIGPETGADGYRVLSNHHCFAVADADGKATQAMIPEACKGTTAYFGFLRGQAGEATPVACKPGSLRTNFDGDLSVFTLASKPPEKHRPIVINEKEDGLENRAALIVHYPDVDAEMEVPPDGGPKLPTAAATLNDCKVVGPFAVSEWDLDRTLPFSFRHTCDLIHGSSGSGLIDAKTGKLLGVNWGGIKISYDDGVRTDNVATRARYVLAFLNGTVEDEMKQIEARRQSADAVASTKAEGGELKGRTQTVAENVKKRCGVVAEHPARSHALALVLALLAPFCVLRPSALQRSSGRKRTIAGAPRSGARRAWAPFLVFAAASFAAPAARATTTPLAKPTPQSGWATSYLVSAAFLAEYESVLAAVPEETRDAAMRTPEVEALGRRAAFALAAMRAKEQGAPDRAHVEALLKDHATRLGAASPFSEAAGDPTALAPTFRDPLRGHWDRLAEFYKQPIPSCPIDIDDVRAFAAHQRLLLDGEKSVNAKSLLKPVAAWDLAKTQCLVFALMAASPDAKAKQGFEPVHLLNALTQTGSPHMQDQALRSMFALRNFQLGQYAEALRALVELSDHEPSFRLAYDLVQRVFSLRQKGEGAVALQGL